jgi:hypothetical protein
MLQPKAAACQRFVRRSAAPMGMSAVSALSVSPTSWRVFTREASSQTLGSSIHARLNSAGVNRRARSAEAMTKGVEKVSVEMRERAPSR